MTAIMTKNLNPRPEIRPVYLIFEFERRAYRVGSEPFTIGRASSCDIVIREPAVSRVHAEISHIEETVTIKPVGARPTVVNGAPLEGDLTLHHGDEIGIGSAKLTYNEISLPLGVSIVEGKGKKAEAPDAADRRPTITNPILSGRANPNQPLAKKFLKPAILVGALLVAGAYLLGMMLR